MFFLTGLFGTQPLVRLLGADAVTAKEAGEYLRVLLLFSPLFSLNNLLLCFVRNDGNPKLPMLGMLLGMLLGSLSNVVLDYGSCSRSRWGCSARRWQPELLPLSASRFCCRIF